MFKKIAIISVGFFILSGIYKGLPFFNSIPIDITLLALLIPIIYFVLYIVKTWNLHKTVIFLLLGLVLLLPSLAFTTFDTSKLFIFLIMFSLPFFLSPLLLSDSKDKSLFIKTLLILSFGIIVYSLFNSEFTTYNQRLVLTEGNPIWVARAISVGVAIAFILFLNQRISTIKMLTVIIPGLYLMLSTGSKGPAIATVAVLVLISSQYVKFNFKITRSKLIPLAFAPLLISFMAYALIKVIPSSTLQRFTMFFSGQTEDVAREQLLNYSLSLIASNPFGVGVGNFQLGNYHYPHNLFLEAFAEAGWLFGVFLIFTITFACYGFLKASKQSVENQILFALFLQILLNSLVSGDMTSPKELYLLLPIGISYALRNFKQKEKKITNQGSVSFQ